MIPNGAAAHTERLRIGDQILKINGVQVTSFTHHQAVRTLSTADSQIILTVRHNKPPEGLEELLIQRKDNEQYGIKIIGGLREHSAYQSKQYDSGIFISKIHRGGVIANDGRLKVKPEL